MELGISGRVAIVAAASEGLGLATATRLAQEGAQVAICARDPEKLAHAAEQIARVRSGSSPLAVPVDLTDGGAIEAFVDRVVQELGAPSILVTNCGGPPSGPVLSFSDQQWQDAFELVFLSALRLIRRVVPLMQAEGWGRIVAITSVSVKQPLDNLVLSNSTRAALQGLLKTLAMELAPQGITVNNVGPGPIATARMEALIDAGAARNDGSREAARQQWIDQIPTGRLGEPEEFAAAVAFLCSQHASFITGTFLPVDGGRARSLL